MKVGFCVLLVLLLVLSGIYIEHIRGEYTIVGKERKTVSTKLPQTEIVLKTNQTIEPKNALSAGIEQTLVEKKFSGTVLVFHHGQIILNKAYGWKDQSKRIQNTVHTQYCIGSVQKDKQLI